ncbi:MAG: hypothetical protein KDG55_06775 [Rhodocyclaceae bacterium]|nr:hypothetical protein [Rhodocyclaceae bacterium]
MPRPPEPARADPIPELPLEQLAGGPLATLERRPLRPYAPEALAFLGALSRTLLASPACRSHPDVVAFAYWCRPAHLARLAEAFVDGQQRLGRGLTLHVAPANVPINFAFSMAFGLLAGNPNLVRVPESLPVQAALVCRAIAELFDDPAHGRVASMNRLMRYPRDDAITLALSAQCQARVLWGGDQTIAHLRAMPVPARCVELSFADRYSLCLLDAVAVGETDDAALAALAEAFFRDAYLLDQNACSSPHLVLWHGSDTEAQAAQARFWPALATCVSNRYALSAVHAVDKLATTCRMAVDLPEIQGCIRHTNSIYRLPLATLPADVAAHRGSHGLFLEHATKDLDSLGEIVSARYQTLTTFGIDREALAGRLQALGLAGIDRIVPVGSALDIGVIWDGHDVVRTLSRIIALQ